MGSKIRGTSLISITITLLLIFSILILPQVIPTNPSTRQDENQPPEAVILKPNNGDRYEVNEEITFDGSSSSDPDNDSLSYSWNFGDGESGSGKITSHSYSVPFVYVIRLTVSDGELNDTSQPVVIIVGGGGGQNQPPSAEISSPSNGDRFDAYETVVFDGSSSTDPEEDPLTYYWDFGDDNTSYEQFTYHEYSSTGSYTVTLTVNDGMYNDSARIVIFVDNNPPNADAGEDQDTYSGQEVIFDGSNSTDPDPLGRVVNWTWDFDNGDMGYGEVVAYKYFYRDTYVITLTVRDNNNATGSDTAIIAVHNAQPVAILKLNPTSTTIGENVEFDGTESYDIDGYIGDYYFDFGDGFETGWISNQIITHSYTSTGIFDTTLKVRDNDDSVSELVAASVKITTEPSQPPEVQISNPSNGDHVSGEVKIEGTATSQDAIDLKIEIQIDNEGWENVTYTSLNPGSDSIEAEWFHYWETETVEDGEHSVIARAFDGFQYSQEHKIKVNVANEAVQSIALTLTVTPSEVQPQEAVEVSGRAVYDTGVSVSDTDIDIEIKGLTASWRTKTDSKGKYSKELQAPSDPASYTIKAIISDGTLSDTAESKLTVLNPPDLTLTSEDITFSKAKLVLGDKIRISAKIHNNGDMEGAGTAEFYDGDPSQDGKLIKGSSVTVQADETTIVTISWIPKTTGTHTILVLIKDVTPAESNLENNQAEMKLDVLGEPGKEDEEDMFGGMLAGLEPIAERVGGMMYLIAIIVAIIVVIIVIIAAVMYKKRAKKTAEEKPKDSRKPPPPSSGERVVFTVADNV